MPVVIVNGEQRVATKDEVKSLVCDQATTVILVDYDVALRMNCGAIDLLPWDGDPDEAPDPTDVMDTFDNFDTAYDCAIGAGVDD